MNIYQHDFLKYYFLIGAIYLLSGCNASPYMQGKRLYEAKCQNCHMEDGSGLQSLIPALSESHLLGKAEVACVIKNGIQDTIFKDSTFLVKEMPGFKNLSITEITNIVNYINHSWHPDFVETTILNVEEVFNNCK